ncbi:MAG: hypothetical protein ABIJ56_06410 [Pseudomonadota bacterium]
MSAAIKALFLFVPLSTLSCMGGIGSTDDAPDDESADAVDIFDLQPDIAPDPDAPDSVDLPPDIPLPDLDVTLDPDMPDGPGPDLPPDASDATDGAEGPCSVGLTGDPCATPAQCSCVPSSSRECLATISGYLTFPGGYCSARCTSPTECGSGAQCAEVVTGASTCLKVCTSASQCRMAEGYACTRIPMSSDTRTYCLPSMESDG